MGNIIKLRRASGANLIDQLKYEYLGNKLVSVLDSNASTNDAFQIADTTAYHYDLNGNMKWRQNTNTATAVCGAK